VCHGAVGLGIGRGRTNPRVGGPQGKGRDLAESRVQILFAAFRSEYQVALEYVVSELKGKTYRCITGFTISKS